MKLGLFSQGKNRDRGCSKRGCCAEYRPMGGDSDRRHDICCYSYNEKHKAALLAQKEGGGAEHFG